MLLPATAALAALVAPGAASILWAWGLPMAGAVLVVNALLIGRLAPRSASRVPTLPSGGELGRFVAVESVTTAVSASVSAFLPALVTQRLGTASGGYFYVPWVAATMVSLLLSSILIAMVRETVAASETSHATVWRSIALAGAVVAGAMLVCLALPTLLLAPLGPDFARHGAGLLRWVGVALPAVAVNLLFWATCLVRRRAWPVLLLNLATSTATVAGVLLLPPGSDISRVGLVHCAVQWIVALSLVYPTLRGLSTIRRRQES